MPAWVVWAVVSVLLRGRRPRRRRLGADHRLRRRLVRGARHPASDRPRAPDDAARAQNGCCRQVTDAKAATYETANYIQAIEQLTATTLRNVIGGMALEKTLTSRDHINGQLRGVLDEPTGRRQPRRAVGDRPSDVHPGLDGEADARRPSPAAVTDGQKPE